jgi:hypothetical protein
MLLAFFLACLAIIDLGVDLPFNTRVRLKLTFPNAYLLIARVSVGPFPRFA